MPELPEVETARRHLAEWLDGASIERARVTDGRLVVDGSAAAFARALSKTKVADIERRGKWLKIATSEGARLFSHLGMTGKWVKRSVDEPTLPWERVRLDVRRPRSPAASIRYTDPRRFGRIVVAKEDIPSWSLLGPIRSWTESMRTRSR